MQRKRGESYEREPPKLAVKSRFVSWNQRLETHEIDFFVSLVCSESIFVKRRYLPRKTVRLGIVQAWPYELLCCRQAQMLKLQKPTHQNVYRLLLYNA